MSYNTDNISPPPLKRQRLDSEPGKKAGVQLETDISAYKGSEIRIYSWNVNGINALLPSTEAKITSFLKPKTTESGLKGREEASSIRDCLRKWAWPHIICLQEVKVASTDINTQRRIQRAVLDGNSDGDDENLNARQSYDAHFCLPTDKYNATGFKGKVHGVCTFVRKDLHNLKVRTVDWDLEGRLLLCELSDQQLVIINVYAVNGTTYDYRDSTTGKVTGTRHDRKREFQRLLAAEIEQYRDKNWHAVLIGDINISRTSIDSFPQLRMCEEHVRNRVEFERLFMHDLRMIDTFRCLHGSKRKYTYRPTGRPWGSGGDRVDMALVTEGLRPSLHDSDMLDNEVDRGPSDHVPLYITISHRDPEE